LYYPHRHSTEGKLSGDLLYTLGAELLALSKVSSRGMNLRVGRNEEAITSCLDDILRDYSRSLRVIAESHRN
jgi:hypothetical protein